MIVFTKINNELKIISNIFDNESSQINNDIEKLTNKVLKLSLDFLHSINKNETDPLKIHAEIIKQYPKISLQQSTLFFENIQYKNEEKTEYIKNNKTKINISILDKQTDQIIKNIEPKTLSQKFKKEIANLLLKIKIQSFDTYSRILTENVSKECYYKIMSRLGSGGFSFPNDNSNYYSKSKFDFLCVNYQFRRIALDIYNSNFYISQESQDLKDQIELLKNKKSKINNLFNIKAFFSNSASYLPNNIKVKTFDKFIKINPNADSILNYIPLIKQIMSTRELQCSDEITMLHTDFASKTLFTNFINVIDHKLNKSEDLREAYFYILSLLLENCKTIDNNLVNTIQDNELKKIIKTNLLIKDF